jgi:RNA polymerase subunit RPABC4/transcription elongation factor Spt4
MKEGMKIMTQKLRFKNLEKFGFGPNVMKKNKVCPRCGRLVRAKLMVCPDCNERLSSETLFDCYKRRHKSCSDCDTVLAPGSRYCPTCGKPVTAKAVGSNER